jgi:hypothetical protein
MTFAGATFASLGVTPGSYTWSWSGDSITLEVGSPRLCSPVTWYLQGVVANGPMDPLDVYGDGTTNYDVTGSFDYDAASNTFSAVNIVTPYHTYTDADIAIYFLQNSQHLVLFGELILSFDSPLTNAGGTVDLLTGFGGTSCGFNECGSLEITEEDGVYYMAGAVTSNIAPVDVDIDIQPGQAGNVVHPHHNDVNVVPYLDDVIGVGVLGSMIVAGDPVDFDTDDIDPATLAFGPGAGGTDPGTPPQFNQNLDADGIDDAVFGFLTSDAGISCGETSATLTGSTTGGQAFQGSDTIQTQCNAQCHN